MEWMEYGVGRTRFLESLEPLGVHGGGLPPKIIPKEFLKLIFTYIICNYIYIAILYMTMDCVLIDLVLEYLTAGDKVRDYTHQS